MRHLSAAGLILLATGAFAQDPDLDGCAPLIRDLPPCLAGAWIGTNTAMEKLQRMIQSMPTGANTTRDVFAEGFAQVLGMQVYPDGFYATIPVHRDMHIDDFTTVNGDTIHVQTDMNLTITSAFGYLWAYGNELHFCTQEGSGQPTLLVESQSSHGGSSRSVVSPFGPPGFTPRIDFTCSAATWDFTVHLPPPVGPVDYYMTRVPMTAFSDEYRALADSRFAPGDGAD